MIKVKMNGTILNNDDCDIMRWWGWLDVVCPLDVERALNAAPNEEVEVYINSPGGDMLAGSEMRGLLRAHRGHTVAIIQSHSASAATIAMTGCDEIRAEAPALICVHNPSMFAEGDAAVHSKVAAELDTVKESIINAYMARCSLTREELSALMNEDKWITPQEALEFGLIDSIIEGEKLSGPSVVLNAGGVYVGPTAGMKEAYRENVKTRREQEAIRTQALLEVLAK